MSQICSDFLIVDAEEGNQTNNNDGVEIEEDSDDIDDEEAEEKSDDIDDEETAMQIKIDTYWEAEGINVKN